MEPLSNKAKPTVATAFGNRGIASTQSHQLVKASPRVRNVYRELIGYIHRNRFDVGEMLPKHEVLRQTLGAGSNLLQEAMGLLVKDGVLERVPGSGTRVRRLDVVSQQTWTIGIVTFDEMIYGFAPMLEHHLRRALIERGCADRTYLSFPETRRKDPPFVPADYAGLAEDMRSGQLDGILSVHPLHQTTIPVCTVGVIRKSVMGVAIDDLSFVRDAVEALRERGLRRIQVIGGVSTNNYRIKDLPARELGPGVEYYGLERTHVEGGQDFARTWSRTPAEDRAQAIVVADDVIASGVVLELMSSGHIPPMMAVQINKQAPVPLLGFSLLPFYMDLRDLAERAADKLVNRLLRPEEATTLDWVKAVPGDSLPARSGKAHIHSIPVGP